MEKYNEIFSKAKELSKLYELSYKQIKPQVIYIIENNIKDVNFIEKVLDELLNTPTDKCYKLFIKLCTYVDTFDHELAEDYLKFYEEMYGADDKKKKYK